MDYSDVPGSCGYMKFVSRLENCRNWFKSQIKTESRLLLPDRSSVKVKQKHAIFTKSSFVWDDLQFSLRLLICRRLMNLPRRPWQRRWRLKSGYWWTRFSQDLKKSRVVPHQPWRRSGWDFCLVFLEELPTRSLFPSFIQSFVKVRRVQNNFTLGIVLSGVLSSKPAQYEVVWMKWCQKKTRHLMAVGRSPYWMIFDDILSSRQLHVLGSQRHTLRVWSRHAETDRQTDFLPLYSDFSLCSAGLKRRSSQALLGVKLSLTWMPPEPPRTSWSALPEVGHVSELPHAPSSLAVLTRAGEQMREKEMNIFKAWLEDWREHVVWEASFPSHIARRYYHYYHISDAWKRLAPAPQVVITAQSKSSNMCDVVLNNVWKQTNKVLKSPAVCYWS